MMEDIAPELLKKVQLDFQSGFDKSTVISELYEKVRDGTATYLEANKFAIKTGDILAEAYKNNLSSSVLPDGKMYYNIAQRIIEPTMENNYSLITDVTNQVQKSLNEAAGIGIKPITPELNRDRIEKIVERVVDAEWYDDIAWILYEPVKNFSQSIVDDSIRTNADFHYKAGMTPKIVRKLAGGCCEWCNKLAGAYRYPDVPKDVYRRHQRCRCTVEYNPGDGKIQDVHTKHWMSEEESNKREARKLATKQNIKKETPEERENRIAEKYGLADEEKRREERIQSTKKVTAKDLDSMSLGDLRKLAKEKAAEYYKSGLSGISFGSHDMDKAAELLTQNASRASLKKDILSIQKKMSKSVDNSTKSSTMKLEDVAIHKSVGAKAKNYDVLDLTTGEMFHFVEGSKLQNVEVFAGKGVKSPYRNAYKYADKYGGEEQDWQHVKGIGLLDTPDGELEAEVHWSQCEGFGKHDFFVKRWLE